MNKLVVALVLVLGVAIGATIYMGYEPVADTAERLLKEGNHSRARKILERHLETTPDDTRAIQLLADSMVVSPNFGNERTADEVVNVLDGIPDDCPEGLLARLQQAELSLLRLFEVQRAEGYTKRAIQIDSDDWRPYEILLNIYQLTRRFPASEPVYDAMYKAAPISKRMDVLQKWYVCQFAPFAMNEEFDRTLNLPKQANTEILRYVNFIDFEPSAPGPRAALASTALDAGSPKEAVDVLTSDEVDRSQADAFYTYQLIRGYVMLGELEKARAEFDGWAMEKDGHYYSRAAALITEEVDGEFEKAIPFYKEALTSWPGPVDFIFQGRYVACLRKAKQAEEADAEEARFKAQSGWSKPELQKEMLGMLEKLPEPEAIKKFAAFYKMMNRDKDSERWLSLLESNKMVAPEPSMPGIPTPDADGGF
jgi:tetratricopeptide (TPR) repeat protein